MKNFIFIVVKILGACRTTCITSTFFKICQYVIVPSIVSFPEEGFPTNLTMLWLSGANLCKQVFELGLHRLTSLTYLEIGNGIMDSFPEEEDGKTMLMLPTSLTRLRFFSFPNLLFLSWKFFQNLSALEEISIGWCRKLASLSEKCFPPSLQRLYISVCCAETKLRERQRDNVVKDCQHPFSYN